MKRESQPPTPDQERIGARIRQLRIQQGRTQDSLAKASGFTRSLICKIEAAQVMPPIATLVRIAGALGVPLSSLLEQERGREAMFMPLAQAERGLTATDKGYSIFPFASGFADKRIQAFLFVARRGEVAPHEVHHQGEEFVHVLDGELLFTVGATTYRMGPGDSLYFDASQPHGIMPVSETVRYLDIFV